VRPSSRGGRRYVLVKFPGGQKRGAETALFGEHAGVFSHAFYAIRIGAEFKHGPRDDLGWRVHDVQFEDVKEKERLLEVVVAQLVVDELKEECFRDPSELLGPFGMALSNPLEVMRRFSSRPELFSTWLSDLRYYMACDFFDGTRPMRAERLARFGQKREPSGRVPEPAASEAPARP
jgi:hypothetical protein